MIIFLACLRKFKRLLLKTFSDINHTNVFLGQSLKAIEINTKLNKGKLVKLKSFCIIEGNQKQNYKTTNRMGENIYK